MPMLRHLPAMRGFLAACGAIALVLWTPGRAAAQVPDGKLDEVVRARAALPGGRSRVIIEYAGPADVRVITERRGRVAKRLKGARADVAEIDNTALADLGSDPRVARISMDRPVHATMARTTAATGASVAQQTYGVTGAGVGVALIDSGISTWHNDLYLGDGGPARVAHYRDFTVSPDDPRASDPSDAYGHGTHVAGIVAGSGHDSNGRRAGIAPDARLVALRVLDADGNGTISNVIEAIDYAIEHSGALNIRVINISVAAGVFESYRSDPLTRAARRAVEAGIVVVTSAGNLGENEYGEPQYGGITAPGNAPWVITVGAASHQGTPHRSDDVVASFSSRGPTAIDMGAKPDLIAPGVGIESLADPFSTLATLNPELLVGEFGPSGRPYLSLSGTSMAAPVVTGAVALMLQQNPQLTPNAVKVILQYTAQAHPTEPVLAQGAGMLNVAGALRLAAWFAQPTETLDTSDTIEGEPVAWSQQLIWGNYRITGGVPMPEANAWDLTSTWGAMRPRGAGAIVWGARTLDGDVQVESQDDVLVLAGDEVEIGATSGRRNIVWATGGRRNIVWATSGRRNIVWATGDRRNIVWATALGENVVWGDDCGGDDCQQIWGAPRADGVWGTAEPGAAVLWTLPADGVTATGGRRNIVWATSGRRNIVWATSGRRNIVWATGSEGEEVVWAAEPPPAVVWMVQP